MTFSIFYKLKKTSVSKTTGFVLVGCGHIAHKHATVIANYLNRARLVAVCDLQSEKAQNLAAKFNVPWFTSPTEMLDQVGHQVDVICILTPTGYHAQNLLALAHYRKHFCVEKPLALTLADADAMINVCDQQGVQLFVVKQNRFNLPLQKLHWAVTQGYLGKLVLGSSRVRWCRPQSYYNQDAWRGTWALDGGVFVNQASHFIDLLQWLMGDVKSVIAKGTTRLAEIETEDTGVAIFQFCNGSIGVLEATTAARPANLEGSLSILGENGTIEVGGFAANKLETWKFINPPPEEEFIPYPIAKDVPPELAAHTAYLQSVVDTLLENAPPAVDGREGRRSLEIIAAVYQSLETGQEVHLGQSTYSSRLGLASLKPSCPGAVQNSTPSLAHT